MAVWGPAAPRVWRTLAKATEQCPLGLTVLEMAFKLRGWGRSAGPKQHNQAVGPRPGVRARWGESRREVGTQGLCQGQPNAKTLCNFATQPTALWSQLLGGASLRP